MNRLILIPLGLMAYEFAKSNFNPLANIKANLKSVDGGKIKPFSSHLDLTLSIYNGNDFPILVKDITGKLSLGNIVFDIRLLVKAEIKSNEKANLHFSVQIDNSDFFLQLSELIESKKTPELIFNGVLKGGLKEKVFELPISQRIPLQLL